MPQQKKNPYRFYNGSYGGRIMGVAYGIYVVGFLHQNLLFFVVAVLGGLFVDSFVMNVYAPRRQRRLFRQNLSADLVTLCAKMCKAKGQVEKEDIAKCNQFFDIPPHKGGLVSEIFNKARVSVQGYEAVALRIHNAVGGHQDELENLLKVLYAIAYTNGRVDEREKIFLLRVADIFGLSPAKIAAIEHEVVGEVTGHYGGRSDGHSRDHSSHSWQQRTTGTNNQAHYETLGLSAGASADEVKRAYRKLVARHHPDRLRHQGLSEKDLKAAEQKMAHINAAYNSLSKK